MSADGSVETRDHHSAGADENRMLRQLAATPVRWRAWVDAPGRTGGERYGHCAAHVDVDPAAGLGRAWSGSRATPKGGAAGTGKGLPSPKGVLGFETAFRKLDAPDQAP